MSDAPTSPRFSAATSTRLLDHAQLEALCADYDGFLLDLWGVVMDGAEAFPGALAWLARRHAEGRPVWFLSNSSSSVVEMSAGLERLGIQRDWFAGITTSGQLTIDALLQTADYRRGGIYLAGVGLAQQSWPAEIRERFVEDIAQAALIVGVGSFPQEELEQRFAPLRGATDLPFLCANPDRVVVSGGRTVYGAGMLAELFSEEGGQVSWYGKPDPAAFRIAQRQLEARGARHILFVGDSLVTDVPGALAARIDTLWLGATGIHREALGAEFNGALDEERVRSLLHGYPIRPHFAAPGLVCPLKGRKKDARMHWLDYLQWPAMLVTVVAAWLVASAHRRRRKVGFWVFLASNLLWIAWGLYAQAYALILLQVCLAAMNLRGTHRNEAPQDSA